jgi:methionine aminotransferase
MVAAPFSKLPDVATTIFTVMSQMAAEYDAINLSQGFPTFQPPTYLTKQLALHVASGANQYAPMAGLMSLRETLSEKVETLYGATYRPDTEVTITSGATEALFAAITAVVRPGDEVIVIEPAYDSYVPAIRLNGGVPVFYSLRAPDYTINWSELAVLVTEKTRAILINTPNNPTGKQLSALDLAELEKIVSGKNLFVISDEVYEHIVFDGKTHVSVMQNPRLAEQAFVIGSFGKTYHITGWKVGFCFAPALLTSELRKVHQFLTFSVPTPFQHALADMLKHREFYEGLSLFYQKKRDLFNGHLAGTRFTFSPTEATFFQTVSFEGLSSETDVELASRLTKEVGVASIPVSAFYQRPTNDKMLRFCFAKEAVLLDRAGEKLQKMVW